MNKKVLIYYLIILLLLLTGCSNTKKNEETKQTDTKQNTEYSETTSDEMYVKDNMMENGEYIGPVYGEEKQKQLAKCDYFIHTSRYEGMPMAVLEALSYGIPCIVTTETNMEDIISGSNGGFVSQCNIDAVKEAIVKAIANNGTVQVNTEWLKNHLLWSRIARNYEKLYCAGE